MCILHIVFCTVCKYVLSICKLLLLFFLHCLEHAHKNFTHQGTCVDVTIKSDLINMHLVLVSSHMK